MLMQYGNKTGFIWLHVVQITHRKALPSIKDAELGEEISMLRRPYHLYLHHQKCFWEIIQISTS